MMLGFFFKCNSCWLANGFIELVNKQRQNSLTRIFLIFMITGVIGFGGFHHSIVGNIEVLSFYTQTHYNFRLPSVSVFSHSGKCHWWRRSSGTFQIQNFRIK
jgi:hypothetical protein